MTKNKDKSVRISAFADQVFDSYIFHKNLCAKTKINKRGLIEIYARKLSKKKMVDIS